MDISAIAGQATAMASERVQQQLQVSVLRSTLDAEQAIALQLIQAAMVPGLGEHVDLRV